MIDKIPPTEAEMTAIAVGLAIADSLGDSLAESKTTYSELMKLGNKAISAYESKKYCNMREKAYKEANQIASEIYGNLIPALISTLESESTNKMIIEILARGLES